MGDFVMTTLAELNSWTPPASSTALRGIYEHSPWIPERAAAHRPFASLAALKLALQDAVTQASSDEQLSLLRAHPELAGKAAIAGALTAESTASKPPPAWTAAAPRNTPSCTRSTPPTTKNSASPSSWR
jgi:N-carbamoyl-L-amino-acid hydrolase